MYSITFCYINTDKTVSGQPGTIKYVLEKRATVL